MDAGEESDSVVSKSILDEHATLNLTGRLIDPGGAFAMFVFSSPPRAWQQHNTFECRTLKSSVNFSVVSCIRKTVRLGEGHGSSVYGAPPLHLEKPTRGTSAAWQVRARRR